MREGVHEGGSMKVHEWVFVLLYPFEDHWLDDLDNVLEGVVGWQLLLASR